MTKLSTALLSIVLLAACNLGEFGGQGNEFLAAEAPAQYRIIYAAGVGNADFGDDAPLGSAGEQDTQQARVALASWVKFEIARGALDPKFAGAPMTMVGNNGVPATDGPFGGWDEEAIATIAAELMAFKLDGARNVLVVSHSNGVISTQQGYTNFITNLPAAGSKNMCIHFHHTQAAGSEIDDFVPLQAGFFNGANGIQPTFRFTYNREDWMTYDPYLLSTVGRRESRPWVDDLNAMVANIAQQLANPNDAEDGGGGTHAQVGTLQDLTNNAIVAGYQVEAGRIISPSCE